MTESDSDYFSEDSATFGDRVAGARRAAGLSQEKLAKNLGVKLKTLRGWENDVSEPRANKLQMLAGVLNVSLGWLLTGDGEGAVDPWSDEVEAEPDTDAIKLALADLRTLQSEQKLLSERLRVVERRLTKALNG